MGIFKITQPDSSFVVHYYLLGGQGDPKFKVICNLICIGVIKTCTKARRLNLGDSGWAAARSAWPFSGEAKVLEKRRGGTWLPRTMPQSDHLDGVQVCEHGDGHVVDDRGWV